MVPHRLLVGPRDLEALIPVAEHYIEVTSSSVNERSSTRRSIEVTPLTTPARRLIGTQQCTNCLFSRSDAVHSTQDLIARRVES